MDLFFSRQSIERIEPMVAEEIKLLDDRLTALKGTGTVVNLEHAYAAITGDIIGQICSEKHVSLVQGEDFSPQWYVVRVMWRVSVVWLTWLCRYTLIYTVISQSPYLLHFNWIVKYDSPWIMPCGKDIF